MDIKVRRTGSEALVTVESESLSGETALDMKNLITDLAEEGVRTVLLDLSATSYIDSSGIGKLLFLKKRMEKSGGCLRIPAVSGTLYRFLDSLAITRVIDITAPDSGA